MTPVGRLPQRAVTDAELHALEGVLALDQPLVGLDAETEPGGDRLRGLDPPLERRRPDDPHVAPRPRVSREHCHLLSGRRQPEPGQPPIEDAGGVVHLAVTNEMDRGAGRHVAGTSAAAPPPPAAAGAAPPPTASSSLAAP